MHYLQEVLLAFTYFQGALIFDDLGTGVDICGLHPKRKEICSNYRVSGTTEISAAGW